MGASVAQTPVRRIAHRTRGRTHGPVTRLMSPSDFGEILKPFVFLDFSTTRARPSMAASTPTRASPP